jgi:CRP-like cAMP-binding protein
MTAIAMLRASVFNARLVSESPPPLVACTELSGDGATYEINFSAPLPLLGDARSDLLNQVARHARYNGIAFARGAGVPITPVKPPDALGILDDVLILDAVQGKDRVALAHNLARHEGDVGDALFEQGGVVASLFVIARGAFEIVRDDGRQLHRVGAIGPGDFFGELALLMGTPHAATVRALTPFVAYELTKEMIAPLLASMPDLMHSLEAGASRAQARIDRAVAAQACPDTPTSLRMIDRIRAFFGAADRPPAPRDAAAAIHFPVAID